MMAATDVSLKLITSGAYIDLELAAEFGQLPPAFLPIGHRRLYEAQLLAMSKLDGDIVITIPESYEIPEADRIALEAHEVKTLRTPDGMKLGSAILYALELLGPVDEPIHILHGDTLTDAALSSQPDVIAVAPRPESYSWGVIDPQNGGRSSEFAPDQEVLAGYFSFSREAELRRSLARARGDFLEALRLYDTEIPLTRIHIDDWLDFGHLQTYYRSRCSIQTQRAFNELDLSFKIVKKSSSNARKIEAEIFWYRNIPDKVQLYTPAFLGREDVDAVKTGYLLEYLPLPTLHELFVFGELSEGSWRQIFQSCYHFMTDCRVDRSSIPDEARSALKVLVREKTIARLSEFEMSSGISTEIEWRYDGKPVPSLKRITELTMQLIDFEDDRFLGIMHGDLCFTNIFYDFRTQRVRVIDPRGTLDSGVPTVWGDSRYDLAKICHSIVGGYDLILAGRFDCNGIENHNASLTFAPTTSIDPLVRIGGEIDFWGLRLTSPEILAISIHLFLSMLPLHSDSPRRQKAFIANALRLFTLLAD